MKISTSRESNGIVGNGISVPPDIEEQWARIMRPYKEDLLRTLSQTGNPGATGEQLEISKAYFARKLKELLESHK